VARITGGERIVLLLLLLKFIVAAAFAITARIGGRNWFGWGVLGAGLYFIYSSIVDLVLRGVPRPGQLYIVNFESWFGIHLFGALGIFTLGSVIIFSGNRDASHRTKFRQTTSLGTILSNSSKPVIMDYDVMQQRGRIGSVALFLFMLALAFCFQYSCWLAVSKYETSIGFLKFLFFHP
jgi:hypothetical protein